MRPFNAKFICFIGLILGLAVFVGCGSQDFFDQEATRITAFAVPLDGSEARQEIDIVFEDCDDNFTTTDDREENFPFDVDITIESDATSPEFVVESYTVIFDGNHGTYSEVTTPPAAQPPFPLPRVTRNAVIADTALTQDEMPTLANTILNPVSYELGSQLIEPGTDVTIAGNLVWANGDKSYFRNTVLRGDPRFGELVTDTAGGQQFSEEHTVDLVYNMQVVLTCRHIEGGTFTITTPEVPVHFLNVNTCD